MSGESEPTSFETFYRQVKSAYFIGCEDTLGRIQDLYASTKPDIQDGLVEYLKERLGMAPLLESSGLEGVVHEISTLMLSLHHVGLGSIVGESMEYLTYEEQEDLQEYFQEGIQAEEDPERRGLLIEAVRSVSK